MNDWKISLKAISHPLTLLSIGLLIVNDHLLKNIYPSWLTGKLSDFAGLFFFPFLLASFIGILLNPIKIPPKKIAILAFGITLVWFAAVKTWAPANFLTTALVSQILGYPTQIVLDPSDLIALVVLWPAWLLWRRMETEIVPPSRFAFLALGLASIASIATSPCLPQIRILRVVVIDQKFYAGGFYETTEDLVPHQISVSNTGWDWQVLDNSEVPENVIAALSKPAEYPKTICISESLETCYRTGSLDQLEMSTDGGNSWKVAWRIPAGRREYMEKYLSSQILNCKKYPDEGPYDLALLSKNNEHILVAAMGNEGVLIRQADGNWERVGFVSAEPTPIRGDFNPFVLFFETVISIIFAGTIWQIISAWGISLLSPPDDIERPLRWTKAPLIFGVVVFVICILYLYGVMRTGGLNPQLLFVTLVLAVFCFFIGTLISWSRAIKFSSKPEIARKIRKASSLSSLGIFPGAWLLFIAWVYGLIPIYIITLILAIGLSALSIGISIRKIRQLAQIISESQE